MIIGIDLGTTNSCAAFWRDGNAHLIPNRLGHVLTPSAVSIDDNEHLIVGLGARERQTTHPKQTATAFKRYMGTERRISLGKKSYDAVELSSFVLRSLKEDAEAYLGEAVTEAVITVPAYFNDKQRKATKKAGELAGLKVERLISEPTAAALAYSIHKLEDQTQFLVFDLGGGTFDVSIVEIFEGIIEVRATTGDTRLGGEDFNQIIVKMIIEKFKADWGNDASLDDGLIQTLNASAERLRRALSNHSSANQNIVWKNKSYDFELQTEEFEEKCKDLINRLRNPVQRALRDSEIDISELKEIILVGGATRMPIVRRALTKMFGRFPAHLINPDEAVAIGAAVQAGLKARDSALNEVALTDVCPFSLGVGVSEPDARGGIVKDVFSPIIERNTTVPVSREEYYSTLLPGQRLIEFNIYQGESRIVTENIKLGHISIKIPPKPAGEVHVSCRFTYDVNGLLEVDVFVPLTGKRENLIIVGEGGPEGKDLEIQRQNLEKLKFHPRDAEPNRAAISRAERCYEENLGETRALINRAILEFQRVIDGQDTKAINIARKELLQFLDSLEGGTFL